MRAVAWLCPWLLLLLAPVASLGSGTKPILPADQRWGAKGPGGTPGFTRHVQPLLGKLGCSNRACHGSFQGKGGFRLSLFGSDPRLDHDNLLAQERVLVKEPDLSLALMKPLREISHKGGQRFRKGSWQHRLLRAWIAAGAPATGKEASVESLRLVPPRVLFAGGKGQSHLHAFARFSDGTLEDVTALTQWSSNNEAVASVDDSGLVRAGGPGDTAIVASYGTTVRTAPILVPFPEAGRQRFEFPSANRIDELASARWRQLGLVPSAQTSDFEFLRRVSIDITGTLPTPEEIQAFAEDASPDKRSRKIDELLNRPEYAAWWTTKLCDLTGLNAPLFLGSTDFGPIVGGQWHAWVLRRVQENVGYDRIVAGIVLGTSRREAESYDDYVLRMSSYVRTRDQVDFTAQDQMPHFWFRKNIIRPEDKALAFSYSFLGVRLDCAQCHKHPFDTWTQKDFKQFTALFEPIRAGIAPDAQKPWLQLKERLGVKDFKNAAQRRTTYWRWARDGKAVPWPEVYVTRARTRKPAVPGKVLGGPEVDLTRVEDSRVALMNWLTQPDNPYFARAFVNRVWTHYFGKGLIDPPDDLNLANPPSNPELLDYLARGFVEHGYDMKWLHRLITTSHTYQLSWKTNASNRSDDHNLSHARFRRLPAEVAIDAIQQATAGAGELKRIAAKLSARRISQQAPAYYRDKDYPVAVFGKPLRKVNCDCERETDPSLLETLFLRNDRDVLAQLDRPGGWLKEVDPRSDPEQLIREAYLRTVSRPPTPAEQARCRQHLQEVGDPLEGLRDLLWALLNTKEFITNH